MSLIFRCNDLKSYEEIENKNYASRWVMTSFFNSNIIIDGLLPHSYECVLFIKKY